jgi:arabinose-5-phosphate isomerase
MPARMTEPQEDLALARRVLEAEGGSLLAMAGRLGQTFIDAARAICDSDGKVVLTGLGKAGLIGRKISATLASTGTASIFLHPVEALHGDLGRLRRGDVAVLLSHSGTTEEIIRLVDHLKALGATLVALTGDAGSPLARHADVTLCYGPVREACPMGLAPTVSTTCMLALGDALALTVMTMRNFTPEDFAAFHPAGDLGRRLLTVEEAMTFRRQEQLGVASDQATLGEALTQAETVPRRAGAMLLVDEAGRLSGLLTDADLRRQLLRHRGEDILSRPVREFMTTEPKHVRVGDLASEALAVLNRYRIDELPVLDDQGRPVGVIDVQDLLGIKTVTDGAGD